MFLMPPQNQRYTLQDIETSFSSDVLRSAPSPIDRITGVESDNGGM